MTKQRYRIDVAYDGTNYAGWQIQPNGVTIQEKLQAALFTLTTAAVKVHGSGRTDRGVHARRQVAHFDLPAPANLTELRRGLNGILPPDIRIRALRRASPDFHARRSVVTKEYRYFIWNAEEVPPNLRLYRTRIRAPLDTDRMREAARHLVGRKDFAAFTANPNRPVASTTRTLQELRITKRGAEIVIVARGEGFLYKMVRSLAGFLVRVGGGAVEPSEAAQILESRVRTARVETAPPEGLFLWNVRY
ncbi:MAG: tRNA pseudouridine(38-40) synthase TruA [Lentisphaerae bacterium]|nr:tRNA pseudouridine(38-40) synthase TruA [Lentisphaerota bacterium]